MEILSAGAFINLENQEKIDQLKYTAAELAKAALETEGFVNEEESARKLGLEFWQGLEYLCRESEQAAVQNIFIGQFLDYLREFRPVAVMSETSSLNEMDERAGIVSEIERMTATGQDQFLGVLASEKQMPVMEAKQEENREISLVIEESSPIENDLPDNDPAEKQQIEVIEPVQDASDSPQAAENITHITDPETNGDGVEDDQVEDEEAENGETEEIRTKAAKATGGLTLPEKEPYQFNKCTVTATIQLLPLVENSSLRRAVFSVKTHDFAPNISLVEISAADLTAALAPELEKVLAQYQAALPFKVMDKMKKEKAAPKRTTPKSSTEVKSVSPAATKTKEAVATQTTPTTTVQTSLRPTPTEGAQGSLFAL